ncbi:MAG: hypothetical protein HXY46_00015 [Syntrophaceae bacterium]|nr:hypothetical protein [Syntrophaceae bacterium]
MNLEPLFKPKTVAVVGISGGFAERGRYVGTFFIPSERMVKPEKGKVALVS